ncbi:hypothetical protein [Pseudonocardia acaciae]|nr:hypothetical protein [Pseudonocardia acaciae]
MDVALLILALTVLVLAFGPGSVAGRLRCRIDRQRRLWDRYLDELHRW